MLVPSELAPRRDNKAQGAARSRIIAINAIAPDFGHETVPDELDEHCRHAPGCGRAALVRIRSRCTLLRPAALVLPNGLDLRAMAKHEAQLKS